MPNRINNNSEEKYCPVYKDMSLYSEMSSIPKIERIETEVSRIIMVSLFAGDDLIPIVKRICLEESVRGAFVSAIGAADRISIASFNLKSGKYEEIVKTGYHEITSVDGNVSTILDENNNAIDLMIHLHITFADTKGNAFGGHLLPGLSAAAVGELYIKEVKGGMYRYQTEINEKGYSTIKFNTPVNEDLIPVCREDNNSHILKNEILTKTDVEKIIELGSKIIQVPKISNITSEAYEYLTKRNIKIRIEEDE